MVGIIVVSLISALSCDIVSAEHLKTSRLVAAETGSRIEFSVAAKPQTQVSCKLHRLQVSGLFEPWKWMPFNVSDQSALKTVADVEPWSLYFDRTSNRFVFTNVQLNDSGIYGMQCMSQTSTYENILLLVVFDEIDCVTTGVTDGNTVSVGQTVRDICQFRYSIGFNLTVSSWASPWITNDHYVDCGRIEDEQTPKLEHVFRACAQRTAQPPLLHPISFRLSFPGYRSVYRNGSRSANWTSKAIQVRYNVQKVHVIKTRTCDINSEQTFNCSADAYPIPTYRWRNVDTGLEVEGPVLNIGDCTTWFAAYHVYFCQAQNSLSWARSETVEVRIAGQVPVYVYAVTGVVLALVASLFINCVVICRIPRFRKSRCDDAAESDRGSRYTSRTLTSDQTLLSSTTGNETVAIGDETTNVTNSGYEDVDISCEKGKRSLAGGNVESCSTRRQVTSVTTAVTSAAVSPTLRDRQRAPAPPTSPKPKMLSCNDGVKLIGNDDGIQREYEHLPSIDDVTPPKECNDSRKSIRIYDSIRMENE